MPRGWSPCTRCPDLAPPGESTCPTCAADIDRARRPAGNPYATRGHQRFRDAVLARDPRCTCRGQCTRHIGPCLAPSTVADHHPIERRDLVSAGLDPNDPSAGRGVCKPCHDAKTARTARGGWNRPDRG